MCIRGRYWKPYFSLLLITWIAGFTACTLANTSPTKRADKIVIEESKRTLTLLGNNKVVKTYKVALGAEPVGAKERQGDHRTPEGIYSVDRKNPNSTFHRALHLSYPNAADREHAREFGASPGGDVEIHGLGARFGFVGGAHRLHNWTDDCIAVTNEEIDEIWPLVEVGTPVEIKP